MLIKIMMSIIMIIIIIIKPGFCLPWVPSFGELEFTRARKKERKK